MGRIMALDVGEKTIGIAFSDETMTHAFPGKTYLRDSGLKRDMAALRRIISENEVTAIVVGLPLMTDGTHAIQAEKAKRFAASLRNSIRIPLVFQDERLSTFEADRYLEASGCKPEHRKQVIDSIAAAIILRDYLYQRNISLSEAEHNTNAIQEESVTTFLSHCSRDDEVAT